ncbi:MAG: serine/threonine-protein kinase [Gemmataceae bacterium]
MTAGAESPVDPAGDPAQTQDVPDQATDPWSTQANESPAEADPCSTRNTAVPAAPIAVRAAKLPVIPGYQIRGVLGRGGMGIVFDAYHEKLRRRVALKMILGGGHGSIEHHERFLAEARAVARLAHPHVVAVYEIGDHADGPFISLEFVEGGSLDRRLAGVPQSPREAAKLLLKLARATQSAHDRGIVHRDLKPANILLTTQGEPKITDFGLAKQLDLDSSQTKHGSVLGTPSYMAPEQAAGLVDQIGPAADVHALGAILYEMLTGRPPFRGPTVVDTLDQVRNQEPVPPARLQPGVPRDLESICLKWPGPTSFNRFTTACCCSGPESARGRPRDATGLSPCRSHSHWRRVRSLTVDAKPCHEATNALAVDGVTFPTVGEFKSPISLCLIAGRWVRTLDEFRVKIKGHEESKLASWPHLTSCWVGHQVEVRGLRTGMRRQDLLDGSRPAFSVISLG